MGMEDAMNIPTPESLVEAIRLYADPAVAETYMVQQRWPDGVTCPHCGATKVYRLENQRRWKCSGKHPKRQFSVKTGTIMEDSPLSIDKWLCGIWLIINAKNGISSYEIGRDLKIGQDSAWFMLHRIRHALKVGSFEKMSGTIEADESFIGGKLKNLSKSKRAEISKASKKPGKPPTNRPPRNFNKTIVMGLLERAKNGGASQMRTQLIETARRPHITEFIKDNVEPKSFLMTDSLKSYDKMGEEGYFHMTINHAISYAKGRIHTNSLENFWSLLARTLQGTYVAVEPFHLGAYLDEQCWRFNHRKLNDGQRFAKAVPEIVGKRLTLAELTGKIAGEERPAIPS